MPTENEINEGINIGMSKKEFLSKFPYAEYDYICSGSEEKDTYKVLLNTGNYAVINFDEFNVSDINIDYTNKITDNIINIDREIFVNYFVI